MLMTTRRDLADSNHLAAPHKVTASSSTGCRPARRRRRRRRHHCRSRRRRWVLCLQRSLCLEFPGSPRDAVRTVLVLFYFDYVYDVDDDNDDNDDVDNDNDDV